jgi:hypothetical protein
METPDLYICDHAEGCTVPDCHHKEAHLPNKEFHWQGFCDDIAIECGEDNKTSCLCVPVTAH